jgi:predicted XRE-type DNA-binding protein
MEKTVIDGVEILRGSDNVFADLGLPDAESLSIKSDLSIEIGKAIHRLGLTQHEAAKRMGIPQSRVSNILRGDFANISERKLMDCLTRLGYDIEINVRHTKASEGRWVLAFG